MWYTGLYIACMVGDGVEFFFFHPGLVTTLDKTYTAAVFITFSTTILNTGLIVYRIYTVSRQDVLIRSRKTYRNIIELLIQSSAVYAITSLVFAINVNALDAASGIGLGWYVMDCFTGVAFNTFAVCFCKAHIYAE